MQKPPRNRQRRSSPKSRREQFASMINRWGRWSRKRQDKSSPTCSASRHAKFEPLEDRRLLSIVQDLDVDLTPDQLVAPAVDAPVDDTGTVEMGILDSPPTPTIGADRQIIEETTKAAVMLGNVPTSQWTYGCTATATGMVFGYYDRIGYANMYTGPANGGLAPLIDLGQGFPGNPLYPIPGATSIIATENGLDGQATPVHVDDYWIGLNQPGPDPWVAGGVEHAWQGCTGDYIGTSQWKWDTNNDGIVDANNDGWTRYYWNLDGSKLFDYLPPAAYGLPRTATSHGMRLFAESRAYTVAENYTQLTDNQHINGFTFDEYVAEINADRPPIIHVTGHSMTGVGYDLDGQKVYLHDTWDNNLHWMTWGGVYDEDREMNAVTVIQLDPLEEDELDFGDAPDAPYPTLLANNGARHVIDPNVYLGARIDAEPNGQPDWSADGDDNNGIDDEDGVTFNTALIVDSFAQVTVTASVPGLLQGWFDFNNNGSWLDAGEQVFADQPLAAGPNPLGFSVPAGSTPGSTFARFRFSTAANVRVEGEAPDGEVEDYRVFIEDRGQLDVKWAQPPESTMPDNLYYGWNELSMHESQWQIAADDWYCENPDPITDITWWGSFLGSNDVANTLMPDGFHFAIWTDVPASPLALPYSHPGRVIWEADTFNYNSDFVGWDFDPRSETYEATYQFDYSIPASEWFYQDPLQDQIYWLSISAIHTFGIPIDNPFGWKTLPRDTASPAPDDAVWISNPTGAHLDDSFTDGGPLWWPTESESWDLAFELGSQGDLGGGGGIKWEQLPDLETGMDVLDGPGINRFPNPPFPVYEKFLADDFLCEQTGPITEIGFWSSYLEDNHGGIPPLFNLVIYSDIPAEDSSTGYSMPGDVLWDAYLQADIEEHYATATEEFYDPNIDAIVGFDTQVWQYSFLIDPAEAFFQEEGEIYWLGVNHSFDLDADGDVDLSDVMTLVYMEEWAYGWKTSQDHFNDDAVWTDVDSFGTDGKIVPVNPPWNELIDPRTGESIDLSFYLVTEEIVYPDIKWEQYPDLEPESGMDVLDGPGAFQGTFYEKFLADDFLCTQTGPIIEIGFWSSYLYDNHAGIPPLFNLVIYSDIPADVSETGYSMPGDVLWSAYREADIEEPFATATEDFYDPNSDVIVGWDNLVWKYSFMIDPDEAFVQTEGEIYWLGVHHSFDLDGNGIVDAADVSVLMSLGDWAYGWKTSQEHFNDDAVWTDVSSFGTGTGGTIVPQTDAWKELIDPRTEKSIDLSFYLVTETTPDPYVKWSQPPMPYYPQDAYNGWDEYSVYGDRQIVADDWLCTTDEPVSDIHWWGSYIGWEWPEPPQMPNGFHIGIWTDTPVSPDEPFSHPRELIWESFADLDEVHFEFVGWDFDPRDPYAPPEATFRFDHLLPLEEWFQQEEGDHIYWVSIAADYGGVTIIDYPFGWKTRPRDPLSPAPDDAVRIFDPTAPSLGTTDLYIKGEPIYWPTEAESWDVAFVLTTQHPYRDFGDALSPNVAAAGFPTLLADNGARHVYDPDMYLGTNWDAEFDGQPTLPADGDDLADIDDEDGVQFITPVVPGGVATVRVTASTDGYLNTWIDFNDDGDWLDVGEAVFTAQPLNPGPNDLSFAVPLAASAGNDVVSRFRFSRVMVLPFDGQAPDGEVEDHLVSIRELDYGDAPDRPYPTLLANNGARHVIDANVYLGAQIDGEPNGQPTAAADGDDTNGIDDEDGVSFDTPLIQGTFAQVTVTASTQGLLQGWIDFNGNGSWGDPGEQIFIDESLVPGANPLTFSVPAGANLGSTYARFRFAQVAGVSYTGIVGNGEVEDYRVVIESRVPPMEVKWEQPPEWTVPDNLYYGWNEPSWHESQWQIAADDWYCENPDPITDITWWGSFLGANDVANAPLPNGFHFAIWTDVPEGAGGLNFSHPGEVIWEADSFNYSSEFVGWDFDPRSETYEATYRFDHILPEWEWFYQDQFQDQIYWLSIAARYDDGTEVEHPFGWKTLPRDTASPAPDDAVRIFETTSGQLGDPFVFGEPLYWPDETQSWDLAFELGSQWGGQGDIKWEQWPDLYEGMDVLDGPGVDQQPSQFYEKFLADDFFCEQTGPITEIGFWSSYLEDHYRPEIPPLFNLVIYSDIPADPANGIDYSMPGDVLWSAYLPAMIEEPFAIADEQFYDPNIDDIIGWDSQVWQYSFFIDPVEAFIQEEGQIYWLGVNHSFDLDGSGFVDLLDVQRFLEIQPWAYGWKSSADHNYDAAVWTDVDSFGTDGKIVPVNPPWNKLIDPRFQEDMDLSFYLLTEDALGQMVKWEQRPDLELGMDVLDGPGLNWQQDPVYEKFLADDFLCEQTGLITEIGFWSSYLEDHYYPDPGMPPLFNLVIYSDIPADVSPTGYSMPGDVLWSAYLPAMIEEPFATAEEPFFDPNLNDIIGWDTQVWQYSFFINPDEAFIQEEGQIYWLGVNHSFDLDGNGLVDDFDVQFFLEMQPWAYGWKSSADHFNDAAVWTDVDSFGTGGQIVPENPPWNELIDLMGNDMDLSFYLLTETPADPYIKWSQPPMPYFPEDAYNGWDEYSVYGGDHIVADDWLCTTDEPVTDIHWWGSYIGWEWPEPPQMPNGFHIGIWTDTPVSPDEPFSHPRQLIWESYADWSEFDFEFVGWDFDPRDPLAPPEATFRFDHILHPDEWFWQEEGDHIYWVSIAADYTGWDIVDYPFGWKTRPRDPLSPAPDDAVRIFDPTAPSLGLADIYMAGEPIYWPTENESWDMAFVLTTQPPYRDFGDALKLDAGFPTYPTLLADDGARHLFDANVYLGVLWDAEYDGQPTVPADGDDLADVDDEDGVKFTSLLVPGETATVDVVASIDGYLNAWLDFNNDGDWSDVGEKIFAGTLLNAGMNNLSFAVPPGATQGIETASRFRFSTIMNLPFTGQAPDGEVEDHRLAIESLDYGDAPDFPLLPFNYPTLYGSNGARHVIDPSLYLGFQIDNESNGQPTIPADGDDLAGINDEDGVVFSSLMKPGQMAAVTVTVSPGGGMLDAWVDFDISGSWGLGEQIFSSVPVAGGVTTLPFMVPAGSTTGTTYARFRLSSTGGLGFTGLAKDGEVEDYQEPIYATDTLYWDQLGDGNWDDIDGMGFSRWVDALNVQQTVFPDDQFTNAVVRTDIVTVPAPVDRQTNHLTIESGTLVVGNGTTVDVAGDFNILAAAEYLPEFGDPSNGLIDVDWTASLDGTLSLRAVDNLGNLLLKEWGDYTRPIIAAAAGVVGTFATEPALNHIGYGVWVTNLGANSQPVTYGSNSVVVDLFQAAPGDVDGDRDVDIGDIMLILAQGKFGDGPVGAVWTEGNFDGDLDVDIADIMMILAAGLFNGPPYARMMADGGGAGDLMAATSSPLANDAVFEQAAGPNANAQADSFGKMAWIHQMDQGAFNQRPAKKIRSVAADTLFSDWP